MDSTESVRFCNGVSLIWGIYKTFVVELLFGYIPTAD
jgi:hypothetical protein